MALFRYKARDRLGGLLIGSVESSDSALVAQNLKKLGYCIISINAPSPTELFIEKIKDKFARIRHDEIVIFTRQLASILKSGLPLINSLEAVRDQTVNKKFKFVLSEIINSLQKGNSFSMSLERFPEVFSPTYKSMIQAAEAGGIFVEVLERLSDLGIQEMDLRSKVKSALMYPAVLVVVALSVVVFFLVKVLPRFSVLFDSTGVALPLPTRILLGSSMILRNFWYLLILGIVAGIYYFKKYISTNEGLYNFHRIILKIPIFGVLILKVTIARFTRTVSTLLKSGVPILESLRVVENTISNVVVRRVIQDIQVAISSGQDLVEPFRLSGLFPPLVIQMVSAGEKSGKLDNMLADVANFYDLEINYTVSNMTSLLEPILLLGMGAMVAFIALSVLLPIFNLVRVFRQ
ncbi:MAG: type II secretion system F family protein [Candidatus Gygaella obscura]|nr:type II secretion system F family protein [Candidatus Gygaella obscura]